MIIKKFAEDRLRSCPFCGKRGELTYLTSGNGMMQYFVSCEDSKNCGCEITNPFRCIEDAVRAWNRGL